VSCCPFVTAKENVPCKNGQIKSLLEGGNHEAILLFFQHCHHLPALGAGHNNLTKNMVKYGKVNPTYISIIGAKILKKCLKFPLNNVSF
jgi:hypothetical protein